MTEIDDLEIFWIENNLHADLIKFARSPQWAIANSGPLLHKIVAERFNISVEQAAARVREYEENYRNSSLA